MKKVPTATFDLGDRKIVSIELVYTPSTFYMKSAVVYPFYRRPRNTELLLYSMY